MKIDTNFFNPKKAAFVCSAFLFFFVYGCNNEQQNDDTRQEAVVDSQPEVQEEPEEPEVQTAEEPATARTNYRPKIVRSHNKLNLDATSMSYRDLDENGDFIITREDLFNGIFNTLDKKEDDIITEEEFKNLKPDFFINKNSDRISTFSEWDSNENGEISREEFQEKLNSFIDIEDGRSLALGKYIVWDLDNDDKIEMLELENFVVKFDTNDN